MIGDLAERVEVRSDSATPDGYGGYAVSTSWSPALWAKVEPLRGQERVIADLERGVQGYRVTVRNAGTGATISAGSVLRWRGIELNVRSAPTAGRALYRTLEAESGTPNK